MPRTRDIPEAAEPSAAPTKLLHAGEVARLAGVHKSTVLQAVRRGDLRASRTVGRSVRVALPDAAAFLLARGVSLSEAVDAPAAPRTVALLTEHPEVHQRFGELLPAPWVLVPHQGLYDDLLSAGRFPPAVTVVDLDLLGLNPMAILRSLRAHGVLGRGPILALSQGDTALEAAVAHGAEAALRASDAAGWVATFASLA